MSTTSDELVLRVIEVTGAEAGEAERLLAACSNNVETAVALFFEQGADDDSNGIEATAAAHAPDMPALDIDEDGVRAPIAPIREQLIGPEDDNFFAAGPAGGARMTRSSQRVQVKVCPLRDFAREGALMEEQLQAADTGTSEIVPNNTDASRRRRARAAAMVAAAVETTVAKSAENSSRLEDLFRPPTDIAYAGTFQTARMRATELKHWLLVNVQSDNFDSQLLNRDVWSDQELRKLIVPQFMLWQIDADSSEGRRFVAFYHCAKQPYVCVIDPRTGEEIWHSTEPKQSNLLPDLKQFLRDHKDFRSELKDDINTPSTSKRTIRDSYVIYDTDEENSMSTTTVSDGGSAKKRSKLLELSEEEQIALAIRNSMQENGAKATAAANAAASSSSAARGTAAGRLGAGITDNDDCSSDFDSVEEFVDDDTKSACERTSYEQKLGAASHELTALKVRLLNAQGVEEMVQLRWPSDTQLQVLRLYIAQRHSHIPKQGSYKLICAYPRKTLEEADDARTLKELGLHPSANLHVTLDD